MLRAEAVKRQRAGGETLPLCLSAHAHRRPASQPTRSHVRTSAAKADSGRAWAWAWWALLRLALRSTSDQLSRRPSRRRPTPSANPSAAYSKQTGKGTQAFLGALASETAHQGQELLSALLGIPLLHVVAPGRCDCGGASQRPMKADRLHMLVSGR